MNVTRPWQRLSLSWCTLPLDLRGLAAMRIIMGFCIVYEQLGFFYWRFEFLSDTGVCSPLPRMSDSVQFSFPSVIIYYAFGKTAAVTVLLLIHAAAAMSVALGFCTFRSCVLLWILHRGRDQRIQHLAYAADGVSVTLCFWMMWLPVGQRYSLDALTSTKQKSTSERDRHRGPLTSYVILFFLIVMYGTAGYYKIGNAWVDGTAAERALWGNMRRTFWMAKALASSKLFSKVFALMAVLLQRHCWPLFLVPHGLARLLGIALFGAFHISLWVTMRIDLFQPYSLAALVACFPSSAWDMFDNFVDRLTKAHWFRGFVVITATAPTPVEASPASAKTPTTPSIKQARASLVGIVSFVAVGTAAARVLKGLLVGLQVFGIWSKACRDLTTRGPTSAGWPVYCSPNYALAQPMQDLMTAVPYVRDGLIALDKAIDFAGSYQKFSVFAPEPPPDHWWVRIVGMSNNGSQLDLWVNGQPCFETPTDGGTKQCGHPRLPLWELPSRPTISERWHRVFESYSYKNECFDSFRAYLCNSWHSRHDSAGPLGMPFFRILFFSRPASSGLDTATTRNHPTVFGSCFGNFNLLAQKLTQPRDYHIPELCDLDAKVAHEMTGNAWNLAMPVCLARLRT
eukprot:TRINITY_DN11503_c0_g1_i1.p1 TRINITY_DN11503_c0_g1~~TRINITY_DN11503_c0_g1_i1.p1  ORF type:complete len:625 (+),score=61.55 TRINITY_DN11503_c0_g1_i1:48-1922(+)